MASDVQVFGWLRCLPFLSDNPSKHLKTPTFLKLLPDPSSSQGPVRHREQKAGTLQASYRQSHIVLLTSCEGATDKEWHTWRILLDASMPMWNFWQRPKSHSALLRWDLQFHPAPSWGVCGNLPHRCAWPCRILPPQGFTISAGQCAWCQGLSSPTYPYIFQNVKL